MMHHGDLFDVLPTLDADSVDACVTDPPYELGFMGKQWDASGVAFQPETWAAVSRVLKPGAYLLAFGGTRTFHRMACAIEDAGFEIRDCLSWLYGQGFPKSLNLGDGRGTALKPAWEPIVLARKPFDGTVAANVSQYGTGALNIDACRIEGAKTAAPVGQFGGSGIGPTGLRGIRDGSSDDLGRWPANVILDEEAAALLDEQSGESISTGGRFSGRNALGQDAGWNAHANRPTEINRPTDAGGASRFFYVAKPSRKERDMGCDGLPARVATVGNLEAAGRDGANPGNYVGGEQARVSRGLPPSIPRRNIHPTVKPVTLMRYLVRLVTPPGGLVLDPFAGSGTTGMACRYEFRRFVGVEREAEYAEIARRRIGAVDLPLEAAI